ncbi:MAG TPA: hypothetical protein VI541_05255, partial [Actinomycetota bacterium]|nr:hypothetical protein [Actinomycetota bacterium]
MKRLLQVIFVSMIVASPWVRLPVAWACSCVASTPSEDFARADVVVSGTASGREDPNANSEVQGGGDQITWSIQVDAVQKGEASRDLRVSSARDEAACGFEFEVGRRYQVFAASVDGGFRTNLCSGTHQLAAGETPFTPEQSRPPENSPPPPITPSAGPTVEPSTPPSGGPTSPTATSQSPPTRIEGVSTGTRIAIGAAILAVAAL